MLIEKNFSKNDVITIKLINGDEIIARFVDQTPSTITINRPMAITAGMQGLGIIPWVFFGGVDDYTLSRDHMFLAVNSKREAADQYLQGTTGIALA
jgi:hypothetical protein